MKPTEHDEEQLRSLLQYMKGTQQYCVSLGVPRKWGKAKDLELLAFATSWKTASRSTLGVCLSFMGVPCTASIQTQATSKAAAELSSVRLASTLAFHTRSLLQDLGLDKPLAFRVLTGGPFAQKLGLSKQTRHIQLWSRLGQFQLIKVQPRKNLAEQPANTQTACGLHRFLPKLKHTRIAETVALPTVQAGEPAFFSSSSSFYIGMLSRAPAMEKLCLEELCSEQLLGKESGKYLDIPELDSALLSETSLHADELVAAYATESFYQQSLQPDELEAAYHSNCFQHQSLQKKELSAAYATDELERTALTLSSLQQKELVRLKAFKPASSTRASEDKLYALASSTRASEDQLKALPSSTRASKDQLQDRRSRTSHNLFLSIFILMVSSLTLHSLSLPSCFSSLTCTSSSLSSSLRSDSFPNGWAHELAEQDELLTTFGEQDLENKLRRTWSENEIEKHKELQNLLWDQELEKHLADKPFQTDQNQEYNQQQQQHDQLGKNNGWSAQLQQSLLESEENKKKKKEKQLQTNNEFHQSFENMISKKLVALLLERHFASAASVQPFGYKAWKKLREASKEISFDKTMGDKELPHQLRREQLDCKELRSDSFRALCPSNFEDSSFEEETFKEETFTESRFTESTLTKSSLTKKSFDKNNFSETFSENSFDKSTFKEETFQEETFPEESLDDSSLKEETFSDTSFAEETFSESSFENSSFNQSSLEESSFTKSSFQTSSLEESTLPQSSFEESTLDKSSFDQHSFTACSFNKSSFEESSFDTSSFTKHSFSKSSLDQRQL